jgi:hypothetical protein
MDEDEETLVTGFPSFEIAREYARRRTRDSLEEQRESSANAADLRDRWFSFGEDCLVIGGGYAGNSELDFFIGNPASPQETDWLSLKPNRSGD